MAALDQLFRRDTFKIAPDTSYPLHITANRYTPVHQERPSDHDHGATLVVLHSTSFHKETWEASLETLFALQAQGHRHSDQRPRRRRKPIREVWVVECPNHGESAVLNSRVFASPQYKSEFGCHGYAKAIHRFLTKGPVSFSDRRLIGVGHSLGANAILLTQDLLQPSDSIVFSALIVIEPMINALFATDPHALDLLRDKLVISASRRQDTWPTRDAVRAFLNCRGQDTRKAGWDERVIDAFAQKGVVPSPAGYTLACTRQQEISMYMDIQGPIDPVIVLDRLCRPSSATMEPWRPPVHLVLGDVKDFVPPRVHDALLNPTNGRTYASTTVIPGVGHLIPQEKPDELAEVIFGILSKPPSILPPRPSASDLGSSSSPLTSPTSSRGGWTSGGSGYKQKL